MKKKSVMMMFCQRKKRMTRGIKKDRRFITQTMM